jgi:hypothetical protein
LIGECNLEERKSPVLIKRIELNKTNSETINQELINCLTKLYSGEIKYNKIKLLLSDQAPYALKTGKLLKGLIPELKHVTCLCHLLHRLCEKIRMMCPKTNYIISEIKRLFIKNKSNRLIFSLKSNIKFPKFPILTRWGTWLEFAVFIADNYDELKRVFETILNFEFENTNLFDLFSEPFLINELKFIKEHSFFTNSITKLESDNLSTEEQINVLKSVRSKLKNDILIKKYDDLCSKNPYLEFFLISVL